MEKQPTSSQNRPKNLEQIPASSNSDDQNNSVVATMQTLNEEHHKLVLNESLVIYTKLEIEKLEKDTAELNERCQKLELENTSMENDLKELDESLDINRHAIKVQTDSISIVRENINKLQIEAKEQEVKQQKIYNEYLDKYKETKKFFEDHHPLFNRLKKLQNDSLKLEVEKKMFSAKVAEMKKQIELRKEIQKKIFHTIIVNFSKGVLDRWKSRDLSYRVNEETEKREKLLKELHELKLAAVKSEDELNRKHRFSSELIEAKPVRFFNERSWSINEFNNKITTVVAPTTLSTTNSFSMYDSNLFLRDKQLQSEKHLEQIRARFDQGQQQWKQQISSLPQKRKLSSTNLNQPHSKYANVKISTNVASNSNIRFPTDTNPITKRSDFPNKQQLTNPNQKVNIISVHSLGNVATEPKREVKQSAQNSNNNLALQASQQILQNVTKATTQVNQLSQNVLARSNQQSQHIYSQPLQDVSNTQRNTPQSQEMNKSLVKPTSHIRDCANLSLAKSQSRYLNYLQNNFPSSQLTSQDNSQNINTTEKTLTKQFQDDNVQISKEPGPIKTNDGINLLNILDNKPLESATILQKPTNLADAAITSPFFNSTKKTIERPDVPNTQPDSELFANSQMGMNSYFDNLPPSYFSNVDLDSSIKLDTEFSPVCLSPTSIPDNANPDTDRVQSHPFNFNFGQPEAAQSTKASFFSTNTISNPFNMF